MRNQKTLITAQHAFRKEADGSPKVKKFPVRVWEKLPKIDQWVDGTRITHEKMGWKQVPETAGTPAPGPLKGAKPTKAVANDDGSISLT